MGKLTDEEKLEVVKKYLTGNYNCAQLAREYGLHRDSINSLLVRRGVRICNDRSKNLRKYSLDENFFDEINTQEKAYFLGLLYSDGYNHVSRGAVVLSLQVQDVDILNKFLKCLKTNKPLQLIKQSHRNRSDCWRVSIESRHLSKTLEKHGCGQAKTFKITWPIFLQKELWPHFIRGLWDGDGYIGERQGSLVGTKDLIEKINQILKTELEINGFINTRHPERDHNIRNISVSGRNQLKKFLTWLYVDSIVHLDRKYQKYLKLTSETKIK